jgi:hypothetical protein
VPAGKIGHGTFLHVYSSLGANWYLLAGITAFDSSSIITGLPVIPVSQAYNVDKKMDDGLPTTGRVQATTITTQLAASPAPNGAADSATTCYNTTGPAYSVGKNSGAGTNCTLSFQFQ